MKKYTTIWNGAEIYDVLVSKNEITIYKNGIELHEIKNYLKIFIGKNIKKYSQYTKQFIGNTILIEIKPCNYMYIGEIIKTFNFTEPILKYISTMGNSGIPYPFGITENNVLLLNGFVILKKDFGDIDPYRVLYDFDKIYKKKSIKLKFKNIKV
jgi:hypothetical protein